MMALNRIMYSRYCEQMLLIVPLSSLYVMFSGLLKPVESFKYSASDNKSKVSMSSIKSSTTKVGLTSCGFNTFLERLVQSFGLQETRAVFFYVVRFRCGITLIWSSVGCTRTYVVTEVIIYWGNKKRLKHHEESIIAVFLQQKHEDTFLYKIDMRSHLGLC